VKKRIVATSSGQEAIHPTPDNLQAGLQEIRRIVLEQEHYTAELKVRHEEIDGLFQEKAGQYSVLCVITNSKQATPEE
jgi:alpha-ketoglutarate-dependent taurine dioxygenase